MDRPGRRPAEGHNREHMRRRHRMGNHPRMIPGRFFETGEMRLALLALISEHPRHGYDLMTELETRSGDVFRPSPGSVYPRLQQLEDEGLVTATKENSKNVYTATAAGRAEVEKERATVEHIWQRAEEWRDWGPASHPAGMEIARHVERLARTAFRAVTRSDVDPDLVRHIVDHARRDIEDLEDIEDIIQG